MELKLADKGIHFRMEPIVMHQQNLKNTFETYDSNTLREIINHPRYENLALMTQSCYPNDLDKPLGDFLQKLKIKGDKNYLKFLNPNGDQDFCAFSVEANLDVIGLFCFIQNNEIKHLGTTVNDLGKLINHGYGKIHPKACYKDGRSTHCRINAKINHYPNAYLGILEMNSSDKDEIMSLKKTILNEWSFEWDRSSSS